ncbi:hypothetical protein ACOME3_005105 [Neoechinorhynchus agilis]
MPILRSILNRIPRMNFKSLKKDIALIIDIDGVVVRGTGRVLPRVKEAFKILDTNKIPYLFLTNGDERECATAKELCRLLDCRKISPKRVITAHSPLRLLVPQFAHKRVLVCGQGPCRDILKSFGFQKICSVDDIANLYDNNVALTGEEKSFDIIKCIFMMGATIRWERTLQVLMDVIVGEGNPYKCLIDPHPIPIIACDCDQLWQGAAPTPRFGHGMFIKCLKKMHYCHTNKELKITHCMGKPFRPTYLFVRRRLIEQLGCLPKRLLFIGDNPDVDVVGANKWKHEFEGSEVQSVLVLTGVYNKKDKKLEGNKRPSIIIKMLRPSKHLIRKLRSLSTGYRHKVGFVFDIDGVITQGANQLVTKTQEAFQILTNRNIPYVFLTNSDNSESNKASELSKILEPLVISTNQIITTHSPLKLISEPFTNKKMLACGQGPYVNIARSMGFERLCTVKEVLAVFPEIDTICWTKREAVAELLMKRKTRPVFEKIDGVILMGSPNNWETSLQVIIDVVAGNGVPFADHKEQDQIPLILCNQDLVWRSSAPSPRMGHGSFVECLAHLFEEVAQRSLIFNHKIGKPFELSYRYTIQRFRKTFGEENMPNVLYFVGDNVDADILGANRFKSHSGELIVQSVLVRSGVYNPLVRRLVKDEEKPDHEVENVFDFLLRIFE